MASNIDLAFNTKDNSIYLSFTDKPELPAVPLETTDETKDKIIKIAQDMLDRNSSDRAEELENLVIGPLTKNVSWHRYGVNKIAIKRIIDESPKKTAKPTKPSAQPSRTYTDIPVGPQAGGRPRSDATAPLPKAPPSTERGYGPLPVRQLRRRKEPLFFFVGKEKAEEMLKNEGPDFLLFRPGDETQLEKPDLLVISSCDKDEKIHHEYYELKGDKFLDLQDKTKSYSLETLVKQKKKDFNLLRKHFRHKLPPDQAKELLKNCERSFLFTDYGNEIRLFYVENRGDEPKEVLLEKTSKRGSMVYTSDDASLGTEERSLDQWADYLTQNKIWSGISEMSVEADSDREVYFHGMLSTGKCNQKLVDATIESLRYQPNSYALVPMGKGRFTLYYRRAEEPIYEVEFNINYRPPSDRQDVPATYNGGDPFVQTDNYLTFPQLQGYLTDLGLKSIPKPPAIIRRSPRHPGKLALSTVEIKDAGPSYKHWTVEGTADPYLFQWPHEDSPYSKIGDFCRYAKEQYELVSTLEFPSPPLKPKKEGQRRSVSQYFHEDLKTRFDAEQRLKNMQKKEQTTGLFLIREGAPPDDPAGMLTISFITKTGTVNHLFFRKDKKTGRYQLVDPNGKARTPKDIPLFGRQCTLTEIVNYYEKDREKETFLPLRAPH